MIKIKTKASPTLSSGTIAFNVGEVEKVNSVEVYFDDPFVSSYAYAASATISGNVVTVTIKKQNLGSPGGWSNAGNSDITGSITIVADCE